MSFRKYNHLLSAQRKRHSPIAIGVLGAVCALLLLVMQIPSCSKEAAADPSATTEPTTTTSTQRATRPTSPPRALSEASAAKSPDTTNQAQSKTDDINAPNASSTFCGMSPEQRNAFYANSIDANSAAVSTLLPALATQLQQHAEPSIKAAGYYLQAQFAVYNGADVHKKNLATCEAAQSTLSPKDKRENCTAYAETLSKSASHAALIPLTNFAFSTNDADVYASAFYGCRADVGGQRNIDADSGCAQITGQNWARLDPNNAVPWLYALEVARRRRNAVESRDASEAALQAALQATDYRLRMPAPHLARVLDQPLVLSQPPIVQLSLAQTLLHLLPVETPLAALLAPVNDHCSHRAPATDENLKICGILATKILEYDGRMSALKTAQGFGDRLGWPLEKIQFIEAERAQYQQLTAQPNIDPQRYSCASMARKIIKIRYELNHSQRAFGRMMQYPTSEAATAFEHQVAQQRAAFERGLTSR